MKKIEKIKKIKIKNFTSISGKLTPITFDKKILMKVKRIFFLYGVKNKIRGELAGHIEDIVVDTKMRGNDFGVSLINELVKIAKDKGCYRITLFCDEPLLNFYKKNGFNVKNSEIALKKYIV